MGVSRHYCIISRALVNEFADADALCAVIEAVGEGPAAAVTSQVGTPAAKAKGKAKAKSKSKFTLVAGADEDDWRSYLLASEDPENAVDVKRAKNRQRRVVKEREVKGKKGFRCLMHVYSSERFVLGYVPPNLMSKHMFAWLVQFCMRWCRGCKKQRPANLFTYGSNNLDSECTYTLQSIWRQAKSQGEIQWFNESRDNDDQCALMISHYKQHRAQVTACDLLVNAKWLVATCQDFIRSVSQILRSDDGDMMC